MTLTKRLWPYLLAAAGLALLWLDRPVGLRYALMGRTGNWLADGWALGSGWLAVVGICAMAVAALEIVMRVTARSR